MGDHCLKMKAAPTTDVADVSNEALASLVSPETLVFPQPAVVGHVGEPL